MSDQRITNPGIDVDLNVFISNISSKYGSFAKSCRFAVKIDMPNQLNDYITKRGLGQNNMIKDLTYLCEAAEYPGRGFNNFEPRYYGPAFKMPYQTTYQDTTMIFICRTNSYERQFFDDWMESINPQNTFDFNYRDQYSTNIHIYKFDEVGQVSTNGTSKVATPSYKFTLTRAWPVNIAGQEVTWADSEFLRLSVTFTYNQWFRENLDTIAGNRDKLVLGRSNIL